MSDDKPAAPPPPEETSRVGKFIVKYHTFLSSFVIGAAGLVATSIWQYRQAETAQHQAAAQQKVAETQAENSWKIERAEILGKNLAVLASSGANSVDQRYGVLLSLTRADIIDPELTISYALELGKDNADYADPEASVALLGLLAATPAAPDPTDPASEAAAAAWSQAMAQVDRAAEKLDKLRPSHGLKTMKDRRASVAHQRQNPPRALKKLDFCAAASDEDTPSGKP